MFAEVMGRIATGFGDLVIALPLARPGRLQQCPLSISEMASRFFKDEGIGEIQDLAIAHNGIIQST